MTDYIRWPSQEPENRKYHIIRKKGDNSAKGRNPIEGETKPE